MAKYSHAGSFNFPTAGTKPLFVVPRGVSGTFAISNNSSHSFILLLNETVTITVRPYGIARIGNLSGGFPTRIAIRTKGAASGAYIYQQS